MRKLLKVFGEKNISYIFNGNSLELFKVTNKDDVKKYMEQNDEFISEKQIVNEGTISKIVLNMSNKCNLKCKYCYADGGKYASKKDELMSVEIFESIIEEILGEGVSRIGIVSFFGGEPLINYPLIKRGITLFNEKLEIGNYEIVTNGWYLDEEMLKFFKEHNVKLAISIDGPQDITDFLRGKGSYAKVMQGLETAKRINYNKIECSATYTKCHEELGYTYNDINGFFKSLGVKATISRVLSNDEKLLPVHRLTKEEIKTDIWESARIIYDNHQSGGINPYGVSQ